MFRSCVALALGVLVAPCAGCDRVFGLGDLPVADAAVDSSPDSLFDRCPGTYVTVPGTAKRYRVEPTPASWQLAEAGCAADSDGLTHLAVFADATDLVQGSRAVGLTAPWVVWVGYARDTGSDPTMFRAVTGEALDGTSPLWRDGEPNNLTAAEYMVELSDAMSLNDIDYRVTRAALCECDARPPTQTYQLP